MKDNPLLTSLLIGLIVVLLIFGVSLLVKMNSLDRMYKQGLAKNIGFEKTMEDLKSENNTLLATIEEVHATLKQQQEDCEKKNSELEEENLSLEKLKEKLEEDLKEELMKQPLTPQ